MASGAAGGACNDSEEPASVEIEERIGLFGPRPPRNPSVGRNQGCVWLEFELAQTCKTGMTTLAVQDWAEGIRLAPSVRFGGTWTCKFDLCAAKSATLDVCMGAHEAKQWGVLLSSDQVSWKTAVSGKSNRGWDRGDVASYSGGRVLVRFGGNGRQLGERVLCTESL